MSSLLFLYLCDMKKIVPILLAAACMASCAPKVKDVTRIHGVAPQGLDEVGMSYADVDSVIKAENGSFYLELPTSRTDLVTFSSGPAVLQLIPDGTVLDLVLADSSYVNSRTPSISLQERLNVFTTKLLSVQDDLESGKRLALETINAERDNAIGALAFQTIYVYLDENEAGQALRTLSPTVRKSGSIALIERLYNARQETSSGHPYRDFSVRSVDHFEYGLPEYSRVRLSDFVGQGRFTLMFLWNVRDQMSLSQIPFIKDTYDSFRSKGLDVVSVSLYDTDPPYDSMYASQLYEMDWTALNGGDDSIADLYGVLTLPLTVYFDPEGNVLDRDLYGEDIKAAAQHYFTMMEQASRR